MAVVSAILYWLAHLAAPAFQIASNRLLDSAIFPVGQGLIVLLVAILILLAVFAYLLYSALSFAAKRLPQMRPSTGAAIFQVGWAMFAVALWLNAMPSTVPIGSKWSRACLDALFTGGISAIMVAIACRPYREIASFLAVGQVTRGQKWEAFCLVTVIELMYAISHFLLSGIERLILRHVAWIGYGILLTRILWFTFAASRCATRREAPRSAAALGDPEERPNGNQWRGYVVAGLATILWVVALVAIERTFGWPRFLTPNRPYLSKALPVIQPVPRMDSDSCPKRVSDESGQPSTADLYASESILCRRVLQGH